MAPEVSPIWAVSVSPGAPEDDPYLPVSVKQWWCYLPQGNGQPSNLVQDSQGYTKRSQARKDSKGPGQ